MSDGAASIVAAVQAAWAAAFAARDWDALTALYSDDALFFGSAPELRVGRADIRGYFEGLPAEVTLTSFPPMRCRRAAPGVVVANGFWRFAAAGGDLDYRLSWTLVERSGRWRLVQHHAGARPPRAL
jgi:uncharacterized protein (TIGR02246 family)